MNITIEQTCYNNNEHYDVTFKSSSATVQDTWCKREDVHTLLTDLFKDVVLDGVGYWELIDKLIEINLLDKDQIKSWVEDNFEELKNE